MSRTYGALFYDRNDHRWVIDSLEPHVAIRLKHNFPRIPKSKAGTFTLPDTLDTATDLKWFIQRYPLLHSVEDFKYLKKQNKKYLTEQAGAEGIKLPNYMPKGRAGLLPGQSFRGYQSVWVDFIEQVKACLLIDDVGLGKTYEGLGVALLPEGRPLVIVCQPHLQKQWYKKTKEFINCSVHLVKKGTPYDLPEVDVYIFKYTQLSGWVDVLTAGWVSAIAFDEVQELRHGTTTNKGAAAKNICEKVPIKAGLTATLIYGYGIEAYNIVNMFRPGLLGNQEEFVREWCSGDDTGKNVVADPDALGAYLRENNVLLRRTKKDVGQEAKQLKPELYWIDPDIKSVGNAVELAEQLAITTLTADFHTAGRAAREFDMRMRQLTGIAKARAVAAFVRMFVESGRPVVVFGWHREVYRIWLEELADLNPLMFTGSETASQKERNKQDFISGKSDILIMSLRSGSGTDGLQERCSTAVHGELDPAPNIHKQGNGRLDRDGQEDEVFAFYAVTNYGSDPVMMDIIGLKESQGRGIQDPGTEKEVQQSDPERIKRMAESFLNQRKIPIPEKPKPVDPDEATKERELQIQLI